MLSYFSGAPRDTSTAEQQLFQLCVQRIERLEARPLQDLEVLFDNSSGDAELRVTRLFHEILYCQIDPTAGFNSSWRLVNWFSAWWQQRFPKELPLVDDCFWVNQAELRGELTTLCKAVIHTVNKEGWVDLLATETVGPDEKLRRLCLRIFGKYGKTISSVASSSSSSEVPAKKRLAHEKAGRLDLSQGWQVHVDELLFHIQQTSLLSSIDLSYCTGLSDKDLQTVLKDLHRHFPKIDEIRLNGTNVRDKTLLYIRNHFKNLSSLAIAENPQLSGNSAEQLLGWAQATCPPSRVDISGASFSEPMLVEFFRCAPQMEEAHLTGLHYLTASGAREILLALAKKGEKLRSLSVDSIFLGNAELIAMASVFPNLEQLTLVADASIHPDALVKALGHWKHLRSLSLVNVPLDPERLVAALAGKAELAELSLLSCSKLHGDGLTKCFKKITSSSPGIRKLTISCDEQEPRDTLCILKGLGPIALKRLTALHLLDASLGNNGLRLISKHCHSLEELSLYRCRHMKEADLFMLLLDLGRCQRLRKLNLAGSDVTFECLNAIGGSHRALEQVIFDGCDSLRSDTETLRKRLGKIAAKNPHLQEISVARLLSYEQFHSIQHNDAYLRGCLVDPLFCAISHPRI